MDTFKQLAKLYIDEKKPEPVFDKPKKLPDSALSDFSTLLKSIENKYEKRSSEDNNHAAIESLATQVMQINQQPEAIRQKRLVDLIYSYNKMHLLCFHCSYIRAPTQNYVAFLKKK